MEIVFCHRFLRVISVNLLDHCPPLPPLFRGLPMKLPHTLIVLIALSLSFHARADEAEMVSLFDGKSLDGWTVRGGMATYRAEDGEIVGKTTEGSPNTFLCTNKDYGDFVLEFDV